MPHRSGKCLIRRPENRYNTSMPVNEKISQVDITTLKIIRYPDPRLRELSTPLDGIDDSLRALVDKMFELMFEARGVGLAAPQVGINVRLFVASPDFTPEDRRVYINPRLISVDGAVEEEEGCLSLPNITARIKRYETVTIQATNLEGQIFEETGHDLAARAFQHEIDHLDGRMLIDRMGSVAKLASRRAIKDLEEQFANKK